MLKHKQWVILLLRNLILWQAPTCRNIVSCISIVQLVTLRNVVVAFQPNTKTSNQPSGSYQPYEKMHPFLVHLQTIGSPRLTAYDIFQVPIGSSSITERSAVCVSILTDWYWVCYLSNYEHKSKVEVGMLFIDLYSFLSSDKATFLCRAEDLPKKMEKSSG